MSEEEQDMFMYTLESIAYISASLAAIIYIWETCNKQKKSKKKEPDLELGLINEEEDEDSLFYSSSSTNSSPGISPVNLRHRNHSR